MDCLRAAVVLTILCPALAAAQAQAAAPAQPHWTTLWAGPIFLGGVVVLLLLRALPAWPVLRGIGSVLWILLMTAGGCLALYAMPTAFRSGSWYLPVFVAGIAALSFAGELARKKLTARPAGDGR
jgi:hypothetical protein